MTEKEKKEERVKSIIYVIMLVVAFIGLLPNLARSLNSSSVFIDIVFEFIAILFFGVPLIAGLLTAMVFLPMLGVKYILNKIF